MKVTAIESYTARDGSPRQKLTLEGTEYPLILGAEPVYNEGDDIPRDQLDLRSRGGNTYYILKQPRRSPEESAAIERQVILKVAVDMYCHDHEPGKGVDEKVLTKAYKVCRKVIDEDKLIGKAKELGAAESE